MKASWSAMLLLLGAASASAAQVDFFAPQGEVKGVRQVAVRFSDPMVAFGDPRLPEPFEIECPAPGTGRWADQKNWVYDFTRDLPAGLRCTFRLKPDLMSLVGNKLGWKPGRSNSAPPRPSSRSCRYRATASTKSKSPASPRCRATEIRRYNAHHCDIRGITERVPVRVISGDERKTLLAARRDFVDRFLYVLFKDGREIVIDGRPFGKGTRFEQFLSADGDGKFPIAVLQCMRRLPNKAQFSLVWGKGIVSPSGVPTQFDQVLAYEVRDTFQARFTCDRVNEDRNACRSCRCGSRSRRRCREPWRKESR